MKERKTGKKKVCKLTEETVALCNTFMKVHHFKYIRLIFYNPKTKNHFTRQSVWKMFSGRAIMARQHSIGAHSTRHTAAWQLYLKTGDINKVRKFLNHDNEKVTQLYLHNKRESA